MALSHRAAGGVRRAQLARRPLDRSRPHDARRGAHQRAGRGPGHARKPALALVFDHAGLADVKNGKVREGLDEIRKLIALHPKEALNHSQLARAFLDVGMGEAARAEAQTAVKLEPKSGLAQRTLAWILQHDLFGRRFGKGFALDDAAPAPISRPYLEHDASGRRYSPKARMVEAIAEYRALRSDLDEHRFDESLVAVLVRAGRFSEALELAHTLDATDAIRGLRVAAAAGLGITDGLEEANALSSDPQVRGKALIEGGRALAALRRYEDAATLFILDAKKTLIESMVGVTGEPRRQDWLVWARIAEGCGLTDAAHAGYRKAIVGPDGAEGKDSIAMLAAKWDKELAARR